MAGSTRNLRRFFFCFVSSVPLLLAGVPAQAAKAEASCSDLLRKAERLENVARDIDGTVAEMQAAQTTSELHSDVARYAEYANIAKSAVDAGCSGAAGRAGALGAACSGWNAGTDIGDRLFAMQQLLEGSPGGAAYQLCRNVPGGAKGGCRQGRAVLRAADGNGSGAAVDAVSGSGEKITDLVEKQAKEFEERGDLRSRDQAKGLARAGRVGVGAASATKDIYDSAQAIATINVDEAERKRITASLVSGAMGQAVRLRELAAQMRVQQCNPDGVDSAIEDALGRFDLTAISRESGSGEFLMTTVQEAKQQHGRRVAVIERDHSDAVSSLNTAGAQAAMQSYQMHRMQEQLADRQSEVPAETAVSASNSGSTDTAFNAPAQPSQAQDHTYHDLKPVHYGPN